MRIFRILAEPTEFVNHRESLIQCIVSTDDIYEINVDRYSLLQSMLLNVLLILMDVLVYQSSRYLFRFQDMTPSSDDIIIPYVILFSI